MLDAQRADELADAWTQHGMSRIALDLADCPDRRITRAAIEVVARDLADGETEVSVLLPDRKYSGFWHRILHDQTADAIERAVSRLPHANVTTVPLHFGSHEDAMGSEEMAEPAAPAAVSTNGDEPRSSAPPPPSDGLISITAVQWRQRVTVEGRVRTVRVHLPTHIPSVVAEYVSG